MKAGKTDVTPSEKLQRLIKRWGPEHKDLVGPMMVILRRLKSKLPPAERSEENTED
mgnify:CR=1 FL=1